MAVDSKDQLARKVQRLESRVQCEFSWLLGTREMISDEMQEGTVYKAASARLG